MQGLLQRCLLKSFHWWSICAEYHDSKCICSKFGSVNISPQTDRQTLYDPAYLTQGFIWKSTWLMQAKTIMICWGLIMWCILLCQCVLLHLIISVFNSLFLLFAEKQRRKEKERRQEEAMLASWCLHTRRCIYNSSLHVLFTTVLHLSVKADILLLIALVHYFCVLFMVNWV